MRIGSKVRVIGVPDGLEDYPDLPTTLVSHPLSAPKEFEKRALSAYIIEPP